VLCDITSGVKHVNSFQSRGASSCTCIILNNQEVLLTLVAVTSESNIDRDNIIGQIKEVAVNMDTIDNAIRKIKKGRGDVRRHSCGASSVNLNGDSGKGLIEARLESEGKCSASLVGSSGKSNSLGLVLNVISFVEATVHHVVSMWAQALRAVHITVLRVADTATDLVLVKSIVSERLLELGEFHVLVREFSRTEGELIDVLTCSMT
jgi:hypothetical protein